MAHPVAGVFKFCYRSDVESLDQADMDSFSDSESLNQ